MAVISTVPTLKTNLLALLQARAGLAGVLVVWGWPQAPEREMVILADVPQWTQTAMTARVPRHTRHESYVAEVLVRVEVPGVDQLDATNRAYVLAAEIEDALRADPSVSGAVLAAQFAGGRLEEQAGEDIRIALLTVNVDCLARI